MKAPKLPSNGFSDVLVGLEKIIEIPVKLVDDILRIPLNAANDSLSVHEERAREQIKLDVRRANEEINEMIADNELKRQSDMVEALKRYQLDLGNASVSIAESIGSMSLDLRERAYRLVDERTKEYKRMQTEARAEAMQELKELKASVLNGEIDKEDQEMMRGLVNDQMTSIINNAGGFIKSMQIDMLHMTENIDKIVGQSIKNTDRYLDPQKARILRGVSRPCLKNVSVSSK